MTKGHEKINGSPEERAQVEAAQRDPAHFGPLYDAHFLQIYAYLAKRTGDRSLAEDLTSEVFRQALRGLTRFEWQGAPFIAWLLRIARDTLADHYAKSSRENGRAREFAEEPRVEDVERAAMLSQIVDRLPAAQRRVIEARFVEQRSIREIAVELDRSEGAVKQLQLRALENLRDAMEGGSR
ncbi:MAG: sigma-70 family RNA polymerase sigma factor [Acidobacteriota bacterium]